MTDEDLGPGGPVGHTPHDSNPQMSVSVDFDVADPPGAGVQDLADILLVAHVSIQDSSHLGIRASLQYLVPQDLGKIEPIGFSVMHLVADRPEGAPRFGPGVIKDLPLARWDRVAQAAVQQAAIERSLAVFSTPLGPGEYQRLIEGNPLHGPGESEEEAIPLSYSRNRRERAVEMVRRVRPDLDPEESKGAARSWNGLVNLAEYLDEYMEILANGSKDPAGEMAERHDVAQATVRTWVHRARQAGLNSSFTGWTPSPGPPLNRNRKSRARDVSDSSEATAPVTEEFREIGEILQAARRESGMTVEEVSKATRVRVAIVRGVEEGNFAVCGGDVYARGHIRTIARAVGLDPKPVLRLYAEAKEKREADKPDLLT